MLKLSNQKAWVNMPLRLSTIATRTLYPPSNVEEDSPKLNSCGKKASDVALRIIKSPLYWFVGGLLSSCIVSLPFQVKALGTFFAYYHRKRIFYDGSLLTIILINKFRPSYYPWWHLISKNLMVGAIPLSNLNHHKILVKQHRVRSVLTIVKPFELFTNGPLSDPVTPKQWENEGVTQLLIESDDLQPITLKSIDEGVEFIHNHVEAECLYAHCKAGSGRSVMMVICYLLKYGGYDSVDKAIEELRKIRPQIWLMKSQIDLIKSYFMEIKTALPHK